MAVVVGVCDPDEDRRRSLRERLPSPLSGLSNLERQSISFPGLDIHWEASPSTPVSSAIDPPGGDRLGWVVGDFDAPYAPVSDAAKRLLRRVPPMSTDFRSLSGQNGYYLAMLFDRRRLVLATDAVGLFPLYYWAKGDTVLFGTSPALFCHHPSFVAEPSIQAIASVLLVNHITGGQALYEGVRRNRPGHYVEWTSEHGSREIEGHPIRMSDRSFDTPYPECIERLRTCFDAFHENLSSLAKLDVFLSGGQDSRMVAGFAARHSPRKAIRAVSLGLRRDQELRYARRVSRTLGWPHRHSDVDFGQYRRFADTQLQMESLQGPFASFDTYTARALLAERGGPFLSGYLGDIAIGDRHSRAALSPKSGQFGFDELFANLNGFGFAPGDVAKLLVDGERAVDEVIDGLRSEWNAIDALPFQRAWLFQMHNRQRYHVGSIIWRLSLGAWPLLPYYNRALLDAVTSMPLGHLADRRMQAEIIKREFPRLATLPLDRNAVGPEYLVTPLYRKFLPPLSEISWTLYRLLERGQERRYYHRTYDFNAPGWRSVRREAERHRASARALFPAEALDRLLPPADATPHYGNAVRDASKTKTLLGLVLWFGTNFAPARDSVSSAPAPARSSV